jgi:hypothetical protein
MITSTSSFYDSWLNYKIVQFCSPIQLFDLYKTLFPNVTTFYGKTSFPYASFQNYSKAYYFSIRTQTSKLQQFLLLLHSKHVIYFYIWKQVDKHIYWVWF